jgi:hypothetical protein
MIGLNWNHRSIEDRFRNVPWGSILSVLAVFAVTDTLVQWAVTAVAGPRFQVAGFIVVAAAVVVGRPARWGSAAGLLCVGVLFGTWATAVTCAIAAFLTTTVVIRLWAHDEVDAGGWIPWARRYVFVATVGVLLFAATAAWLLDVLGWAAFSVTVGQTMAANLPLALAGAPLVRAVSDLTPKGGQAEAERPVTGAKRGFVAIVTLVWIVSGSVGSFLFRAARLVPSGRIGRRFHPSLETFIFLWGWQGTYAQLVLGLVVVAVLAGLLRR